MRSSVILEKMEIFKTVSAPAAPLLSNRIYEFVQLRAVKFCIYVFSLRKNITQENSFHVPKNRSQGAFVLSNIDGLM